MHSIQTKLFGLVDYEPASIITLEEGLIGIADKKRFLYIEKEDGKPLGYFQSVDDANLTLVVINPFLVEQNYQFYVAEEDLKGLEIKDTNDFMLLAIIVFSSKVEEITVNLKAPILINVRNRRGKQVILLNDDYGVAEPLLKPSTLLSFNAPLREDKEKC